MNGEFRANLRDSVRCCSVRFNAVRTTTNGIVADHDDFFSLQIALMLVAGIHLN
jgi:hypothetical protein